MKINSNQPLATYAKATQNEKVTRRGAKPSWKVLITLFGVLLFVVGSISVVLITRQQDTTPVAPTAPTSEPAAYIEQTATCTLTFTVGEDEPELIACGESGCQTDNDCVGSFVCVEADDGDSYCADSRYTATCTDSPSYSNCCTPPEEEEDLACGEVGCSSNSDCSNGLICVEAEDGNGYCSEEEFEDACAENPSEATCCTPPTITTQPPTVTTVTTTVTQPPTVTTQPPAQVTTVVTTVNCNDTCVANADCRNISHICYEGRCRLDVNPTDAQCRLPSGETTITRPVVVPTESGPADWLNYLKAGLGVLGIGALLMLLL